MRISKSFFFCKITYYSFESFSRSAAFLSPAAFTAIAALLFKLRIYELALISPVKFLKPFCLKNVVVTLVVDGCLMGSKSRPGPSRSYYPTAYYDSNYFSAEDTRQGSEYTLSTWIATIYRRFVAFLTIGEGDRVSDSAECEELSAALMMIFFFSSSLAYCRIFLSN